MTSAAMGGGFLTDCGMVHAMIGKQSAHDYITLKLSYYHFIVNPESLLLHQWYVLDHRYQFKQLFIICIIPRQGQSP